MLSSIIQINLDGQMFRLRVDQVAGRVQPDTSELFDALQSILSGLDTSKEHSLEYDVYVAQYASSTSKTTLSFQSTPPGETESTTKEEMKTISGIHGLVEALRGVVCYDTTSPLETTQISFENISCMGDAVNADTSV